MIALRFATAASLACAASALHAQNRPALPDVLEAAAAYVVKYAEQIATVIGEEQYTQHDTSSGQLRNSRRIKSDFAVLGLSDGQVVSFRDAFELDGTALRPREERLQALFKQGADPAALESAQELSDQSVRQYVSPNLRVLDRPLLPLEFVRKQNHERFAFKLDNVRKMDGQDVAVVRFTEQGAERFIKSPTNTPLAGRLWIEVATGAVRETELSFSGKEFNLRAAVKYTKDGQLGLWLPAEMTVNTDIRGAGDGGISNMGAGGGLGVREALEGRAYYSKYRKLGST